MNQQQTEFVATAKITPEAQNIILRSSSMLDMVNSYGEIDSPDLAETVNTDLQQIKAAGKKIDEIRKSIVKPLDEARANAQAFFVPAIEALKSAETHCKNLLINWNEKVEAERREAERRRQETERRARQEAETRAAAERAKAAEMAREERRKAEEAEVARQKAVAEGNVKAATKAAAEAAIAQERARTVVNNAEAKISNDEASAPVLVAAQAPTPQTKGLSVRTKWKSRTLSKTELIKAAAADPQYEAMLLVNEKAADAAANAFKKDFNIPGLEAYEERIAVSRAA